MRLVSKIITSASSEAAMTMMVMNLVSDRRASTAERSSLRRRISSSAMNFEVSTMAKPMMTRPALSSTPEHLAVPEGLNDLPERGAEQDEREQHQKGGGEPVVEERDPFVELPHGPVPPPLRPQQ